MMKRDAEFYLLLLSKVLLEIRNLEDAQLKQARSLAYIFHNVPGLLRCNFDGETAEEVYETILSRAEVVGLSEWVIMLEKNVVEQLTEEQALITTD